MCIIQAATAVLPAVKFFLSILHVKKNETGGDGETGKESVSAVQSH